jgi:signal transduction histidine kinase
VHARLAWAVVAVTVLAVALDTAFTAAHRPLQSEATWADHGWPLAPLASLGCALMGALIVSRYPRNSLGWLLCAASLLSVTLAAEAYSVWVLQGDGPGSASWALLAAWAAPLLGWPAFTALIMVFLISPDGHLPSPRWRWAVRFTVTGLVLHTVGTLMTRPGAVAAGEQYHQRDLATVLLTVGYLLVAAGLVASAVSLVLRLRRARDDVRRQLLWITSSAAFLAIGVVLILVIPRIQGEEGTWVAALPLRLAQLAVPLCVAVAVLRYRLLPIELIVNRALVVALAAGLVAIGYVLVVVVIGVAVGGGTGGFWPSLLATAVVAIAFQPVRGRVVKIADRLAFGAAAAPYEALADFSRRLGDRPDPSALLPAVAQAAGRAVNASRARAMLHVEAGPDRSAVWPPFGTGDPAGSGRDLPVVNRGERLGSITVWMPAGHPLRRPEHRLLADLADQAGLAFRNAALTAELSGQVEQLGLQTHELAESRRRLITAGDAERSRLERDIARQVRPHLTPLPDRLRQLSDSGRHGASVVDAAQLAPLIESLNSALDALREITRGIFPAQLAHSGLPTALGSLLARPGSAGQLVVEDPAIGRRFDPRVEAAAYFCVAEAARELEAPVRVRLTAHGEQLQVVVSGRDRGGLPLGHMRDRIEAAGGSMSVTANAQQTVVEVRAAVPVPVTDREQSGRAVPVSRRRMTRGPGAGPGRTTT